MQYINKPSFSEIILEILLEKGERVGYNELYKKLDNRIHPDRKEDEKSSSSSTRYSTTLKFLLKQKMIKKETEDRRNVGGLLRSYFSLTEIGKICAMYRYKEQEFSRFLKISQMICMIAYTGYIYPEVRRGEPQEGDFALLPHPSIIDSIDLREEDYRLYYKKSKIGVSINDILEKKYLMANANYNILSFTRGEIQSYFELLLEKGIIRKHKFEDSEWRYAISEEYSNFYKDVWIVFYTLILNLMEKIIRYYPRKSNNDEKKWYIEHCGKDFYDGIHSYSEFEKTNGWKPKKINSNAVNEEIKDLSSKVIRQRNILINKYKNDSKIEGLEGLEELIISMLCPDGLYKKIKEYTNLKK